MAQLRTTSRRRIWGAVLIGGLLVGCASQTHPGVPGKTPILVIGSPGGSPSVAPTETPALSSPSPSVSASPLRPQPTPESGFYPAPDWDWAAYGDTMLDRAFRHRAVWTETWRDLFHMEEPRPHDLAVSGEVTADGLKRLDEAFAGLTAVKYVGISYGTSDCTRKVPVPTFKRNLKAIVEKVLEKGLVPVVGSIPYGTGKSLAELGSYNQAVLEVRQELGVAAGPDLYGLIMGDTALLDPASGVALTSAGNQEMMRQWAKAIAELAGFGTPADLAAP